MLSPQIDDIAGLFIASISNLDDDDSQTVDLEEGGRGKLH